MMTPPKTPPDAQAPRPPAAETVHPDDDPFAAFGEWDTPEDRAGYAGLGEKPA